MELYILDSDLQVIDIVDTASSVIWIDRYYEPGDFEIYIRASAENIALFQKDGYIKRMDSDMVGIIERIAVNTDIESGNYLTVTGRDLKSILGRRIVWDQTNLSGNVETAMRQLIIQNVISPTIEARKINNVILAEPKGFTEKIIMQTTGDNLLDKIIELCKANEIGWKVTLNSSNKFVIEFYKGTDRSYGQNIRPYVVFSPEFDNLIKTEVEEDLTELKNVALIAGEGEGTSRKTQTIGTESGLNRRELYVDAKDISSNDGEISSAQYKQLLIDRGNEKLAEAVGSRVFSGEAETALTFVLNEDYFLGDIVAVANEYGVTGNARILEVIECEDDNGYNIIPTFEEWRQI